MIDLFEWLAAMHSEAAAARARFGADAIELLRAALDDVQPSARPSGELPTPAADRRAPKPPLLH